MTVQRISIALFGLMCGALLMLAAVRIGMYLVESNWRL